MESNARLDCRKSYDVVADEYVDRIFDELRHKPLDRELLDRLTERTRGLGIVCDMGCGPGHVARYLHSHGASVFGVDLSPGMVQRARQLTPEVDFQVGDMLDLDVAEGAWAGIIAFYSLIHIPRSDLPQALGEFKRVLRTGGTLLAAFHIGDDTLHLDEWWGQAVCVDFHFFRPNEMAAALQSAGFHVEKIIEREPYPEIEHQSRRAYIFANKP
jgi:SAM-dependent methyltransferase